MGKMSTHREKTALYKKHGNSGYVLVLAAYRKFIYGSIYQVLMTSNNWLACSKYSNKTAS